MMGRLDIEYRDCDYCEGSGRDPKNRKRDCPYGGNGKREYCSTCGHSMPCPGSYGEIDQSYCTERDKIKRGSADRTTRINSLAKKYVSKAT